MRRTRKGRVCDPLRGGMPGCRGTLELALELQNQTLTWKRPENSAEELPRPPGLPGLLRVDVFLLIHTIC